MMTLYYGYDRYTEETREPHSDDEWDRGDTSSSYNLSNNVYLTHADVKETNWESFKLSDNSFLDQDFFLLVAIYSTGDSFGHDDQACLEVLDAFRTQEEAEQLEGAAKNCKNYDLNFYGRTYHIPWNGYFESLNYLEIVKVKVM